jgi:hypothetical protein
MIPVFIVDAKGESKGMNVHCKSPETANWIELQKIT